METEKNRNAYKRYWRNWRNYHNHVDRMEEASLAADRSFKLAQQALEEMYATNFLGKKV